MNNYVIEVEGLTVKYNEGNIALKDVSFKVEKGDYLGIIGPNGGGKSTLLKAMLGLIDHQKGSIKFFNKELKNSERYIGYVPQFTSFDREFPITSLEVVLTSTMTKKINPFHRYSNKEVEVAMDALKQVKIEHLASRQIKSLSGGEFQRLLIARALALKPEILLLDEPTASVDSSSRKQIYSLLASLNKSGTTVLMISHDTMAISSQVKHIACVSETLIYHGNPELDETVVEHMYGCPIDLLAHGIPHRVLSSHDSKGEANV